MGEGKLIFDGNNFRLDTRDPSELIVNYRTYQPGKNIMVCHGHEHYRYSSFAEYLASAFPDRTLFYWCVNDFRVYSIRDFLDAIIQKNIGILLTCEGFPNLFFAREKFDLFGILKVLGIRSFIFDYDPVDEWPIYKLLNDVECRFSTWQILNKLWDNLFKINSKIYTPVLQHYGNHSTEAGEKIIICSKLRTKYLTGIGDDLIVTAWESHLSKRNEIMESSRSFQTKLNLIRDEAVEITKIVESSKLMIARWIRDKTNLEIYGNKEWSYFFPENYKGHLSEQEVVAKLLEHNVFVIPNISPTYMDGFGPLFDMVRFGKKFLHPKVISGNLNVFEFSSADELNDKLKDLPDQTTDMAYLKDFYQTSIDKVIERVKHAGD